MASARPPTARPPTHHLLKFPLLSREELDNSPSRKDNVSMEMEERRRLLTAQHVQRVCATLDMKIDTWAIAMTLFYRFYARKSMKRNNTFIVAAACLFLAGKINDKPRHHSKVANLLLSRWYNKDNPQLQRLAAGAPTQNAAAVRHLPPAQVAEARAFWENMYASVLEAERSLLYTLGFDFNIDILHTHLARLLKRPRFRAMGLDRPSKPALDFQQYAISMANDIYTKDGTLVLEWPLDKIAIGVYYLIFKGLKSNNIKHIPLPAPTASGMPWYVEEGLSTEECTKLTGRMTTKLYGSAKKSDKGGAARPAGAAAGAAPARSGRPAVSAVTAGGAASTMMLGACESVAYSGAGTVVGGGISDLADHTSVARPLSSEGGSGAGSKRPAADSPTGGGTGPAALSHAAAGGSGTAAHVNKRARHEEPAAAAAACHEATSAAQRTPASLTPTSLTPTSLTPASQGSMQPPGAAARPQAPAAAHPAATDANGARPAQPAGVAKAPPAAQAAEDSDKEEGELEEGELA